MLRRGWFMLDYLYPSRKENNRVRRRLIKYENRPPLVKWLSDIIEGVVEERSK